MDRTFPAKGLTNTPTRSPILATPFQCANRTSQLADVCGRRCGRCGSGIRPFADELGFALGAIVVASLVCTGSAYGGIKVGHREPAMAAYLTRFWDAAVVLVLALVGVGAAWTEELLVAPKDSSASINVAFALLGAAVAAGVKLFTEFLESMRARNIAGTIFCRKYGDMFPALPARAGPGERAYRALETACRSGDEPKWSLSITESTLTTVAEAIEAGEFEAGPNWSEIPPPAG